MRHKCISLQNRTLLSDIHWGVTFFRGRNFAQYSIFPNKRNKDVAKMSCDVIQIYSWNHHILTRWRRSTAQNRRVLRILYEYCQSRLTYDHLKTESLPYKPLYFSPGSKSLTKNQPLALSTSCSTIFRQL